MQVGASEAALLGKLGVKPFKYGLEVLKVYENGSLFDVAVLDITDDDLVGAVSAGLANIAALSLAVDYPTLASIPHSVINGYKNVLAIAIETDYSFPLADKVGGAGVLVRGSQEGLFVWRIVCVANCFGMLLSMSGAKQQSLVPTGDM